MSQTNLPKPAGSIISADLTTAMADHLRDFYTQVIGWTTEEMPMQDSNGDYSDYVMKNAAGDWVAGICHLRGVNLGLPPQWIIYITVQDPQESMKQCLAKGGEIIKEVKDEQGNYVFAILKDPAGAVFGVTRAQG